jgi:hypothetical protein
MMLSTIILILNIVALIINGNPFMPFIWNLYFYLIETTFYLVIILLIILIGWIMSR